ncbi:cytochrome P450 [Streptomyces sp. NPDC014882]|uniref:cytochrome P450 n=1 Tax=Streptomyces sp. NPDC014882 TaxID=3364927 RepID=UPI0036F93877
MPVASGSVLLAGHRPAVAAQRLAFFERVRSEGPVLRLRMGRTPTFLINDHAMVREILGDGGDTFARGRFFTKVRPLVGNGLGSSDGAFHLRQRRMVQPAFSHDHPGYDVAALLAGIKAQVDTWKPGAVLDMAREMDTLANDLINTALFSSDKVAGDAATIRATIADFIAGVGIRSVVPSDLVDKLPTPANRRFIRARDRLEEALASIINRYLTDPHDHDDILSSMVAARDADGRPMSPGELRDEVLSMLIAGGDSSGHALGWAFHEIAQHPTVARRLREEFAQVLDGRDPTMGDLRRLVYTRQVINETLRLRTPGWMDMRRTTRPVQVGGFAFPAEAELLVSLTALHRDPAVYSDPTTFNPDRWSPGHPQQPRREMFMPFGAGTRLCAGESMANLTMAFALATVLPRFELRPVPGRPVREVCKGIMGASAVPMTVHPLPEAKAA